MGTEAKFSLELELRTTEVDSKLRATPVALMGMFQEAAVWQAEKMGLGPQWLRSRGLAWAMAHVRMRIESLPVWPARLKVTTWASEMSRFLSRREFLVSDERGAVARGCSLWALLDFTTRRAVQIPADISESYTTCAERALDVPFSRPAQPPPASGSPARRVEAIHLDVNEHANNLVLLGWLLEAGSGGGAVLRELNLRLQKELRLGDEVTVHSVLGGQDGGTVRLTSALLNADGQPAAFAEAVFRPA